VTRLQRLRSCCLAAFAHTMSLVQQQPQQQQPQQQQQQQQQQRQQQQQQQREVEQLLERQQALRSARSFGACSGCGSAASARNGSTSGGRCVSEPLPDPLLLDVPYSVRPKTPGSPAPGRDAMTGATQRQDGLAPATNLGFSLGSFSSQHSQHSGSGAWGGGAVDASAGAASGPTSPPSPGLAALAAYKRQWYTNAPGSVAGGILGGASGALSQSAAAAAAAISGSGRTVLSLRSRPNGVCRRGWDQNGCVHAECASCL